MFAFVPKMHHAIIYGVRNIIKLYPITAAGLCSVYSRQPNSSAKHKRRYE